MAGCGSEILATLRDGAAARFADGGWPTPAAEAWKFTNLNRLGERAFRPAATGDTPSSQPPEAGKGGEEARLFFHNGVFQPELSDKLPGGIALHGLEEDAALAGLLVHDKLRDHPVADQTFAAMAGGVGLRVAGRAKKPLTLVFRNDGDDISAHPVVAIDIAAGASATILERHIGDGAGLSMPVMAVNMGEGANLGHARVQEEGDARHHLGQTVFTLAGKARYSGISVQTGCILSRSENHFSLTGEEADASLTTLYLATGEQVMDVTSFVGHEAPSCTSMQVVRGVLDGKARGVFQGKVLVAQDAQHTDGNQMSRTLLLSRDCEADAKPELEIYADDVACSHGATVGELEDDHLFYLMSRGISAEEARQILIEAFLADVVDEIEDGTMRDFAMAPVAEWLKRLGESRAGDLG